MDFLTRLSLKRPVSTVLVLIALIIFGASSLLTFELELMPEVTAPAIMIQTTYENVDAETVEKLVTRPIEEMCQRLGGVYGVASETSLGYSMVEPIFDYSVDLDKTLMDIKAEIEMLDLPKDCNRPKAAKDQMPSSFMTFEVNSQSGADVLNYVNNTIKPRIERISGVAEVKVYGGEEEYIRILLNETLMDQYSVTLDSVKQALTANEYTIPADKMRQGSLDIRLSASSTIKSIEDLGVLPVRTGKGAVITLKDIAQISYNAKKATSISRHNGKENVQVVVTKNKDKSTVTVARNVKSEIEKLEAENPGMELKITDNSADGIITSLKEVGETLIIGILLSMFTLFLFFGDIKASLIVGSSMPISLLATLIIMAFLKLQLNIMTLSGLVIAIGMMVDGSIVVLESCFRAQERGLDFRESALKGTKEVTASIVASTITTVVVYAPIAIVGGMISTMFMGLCVTIIISMLTSLLVSITFIPLFFSFYKPVEKKNAPAVRIMEKIAGRYARAVRKIIPKRLIVVTISLLLFGGAVLLATKMNFSSNMSADQGIFQVKVACRKGTALDITDQTAKKYEELLMADPDIKEVNYSANGNEATIRATILKDSGKTTNQKVDEYNLLWTGEKGVDITVKNISESSSDSASNVSVTLAGDDLAALKQKVYKAVDAFSAIPGALNVSSDLQTGSPEARIHIDPKKAMDAGLDPQNVAVLIANVNSGVKALKIKTGGTEQEVRLEYPEGRFDDIYKLMSLKLTGQNGQSVTLGDIATLDYEETVDTIVQTNGRYSLAINILTTEDEKFRVKDEANELLENLDLGNIKPAADIYEEINNGEFKKIGLAIAASVFLVFMVMAMQFESARFSTMVMMSIPFSLVGAIGLLFVANGTISFTSALGVLMLVGIVVNDGILFVDTANSLKKHFPVKEALARSGELRLRPILMTTLTTVLSMIPLVLSKDSGASLMDGMALIIIGGLCASTLLILFLLPTFYTVFMGKKAKLEDLKRFPPEEPIKNDKASGKKKSGKKKGKKSHGNKEKTVEEKLEDNAAAEDKPEEKLEDSAGAEDKPEEEKQADNNTEEEKPVKDSTVNERSEQ